MTRLSSIPVGIDVSVLAATSGCLARATFTQQTQNNNNKTIRLDIINSDLYKKIDWIIMHLEYDSIIVR